MEKIKEIPFFFIIGRPRSGTTMLRTVFDSHPNVLIPMESSYILRLSGKYKNIKNWTDDIKASFYHDLFNKKDKINQWPLNKEKLRHDLMSVAPESNYSTICKTVHSNYQSAFRKEEILTIGDKMPKYAVKADNLMKLFPDCFIIHIIRDYRDHLYSMLKVDFSHSIVPEIIYQWKYSALLMEKLKTKFPERIYTVRYEDFVNNTNAEFSNICHFLNIPFQSEALYFHTQAEKIKSQYNQELFDKVQQSLLNPIDNRRTNLWTEKLSKKCLITADIIAWKTALKYHYQPKNTKTDFKTIVSVWIKILVIRSYYMIFNLTQLLPSPFRKIARPLLPKLYTIYYFLFPGDKNSNFKS